MDSTESVRKEMVEQINADPGSRESLEKAYGKVWDTDEMRSEFESLGFAAPFIVVRRKLDGKRGTLTFQHHPRFYFEFAEA